MSKVDDELTRRLHGAERPVDVDAVFEGLERRRSHRERVRRVQAGLLAFAVLAATAGGFAVLREAFQPDGRGPAVSPSPAALSANGEIVFVKDGQDDHLHIYAAQPDGSGVRQITDDQIDDSYPAVSLDGRTVAFGRTLNEFARLMTIPIAGGEATPKLEDLRGFRDVAWAPDGSQIAYVVTGIDSMILEVMANDSSEPRTLFDSQMAGWVAHPTWSPDGHRIAAAFRNASVAGIPSWDLALLRSTGPQVQTEDLRVFDSAFDEVAPAWSPDGSRIAFIRTGDSGQQIRTISPDGEDAQLVAVPRETLEPDLAWAPDGTALLVSDGSWIYRVDATSAASPEDNLVRLMRGHSPSWQPLPPGFDESPKPDFEPSTSSIPQPATDELGFGFPVCQVSDVQAQFDGTGDIDTAYVAIARDGGGCPPVQSASAYVGIDLDEDGVVDATHGPIPCEVYYCRAFAAPDLDDSGTDELLVVESAGSITGLGVYALGDATSDGGGVVRVHIGEPDLVQTGFVTGEPARLFIGGDEGWSYRLRCEDQGSNRFIYQQRAFHPVDSTGPAIVEGTTLIYFQGRLDVFDAREPEQSTSDDPLGPQPAEVCGASIPTI